MPKTTFRTKIGGGWARGASKNLGKQCFGPKLAGVWARGASKKNWDPLCIFVTVEASNFKFGTQLGFGTSLPKKQRLGPQLAGVWAKGASKKIWDPMCIFATVGIQLGFGTIL